MTNIYIPEDSNGIKRINILDTAAMDAVRDQWRKNAQEYSIKQQERIAKIKLEQSSISMDDRIHKYIDTKSDHNHIFYVIQADDCYKIGVTYNLSKRFKTHQTSNHRLLNVVAVFDHEYLILHDITGMECYCSYNGIGTDVQGVETFFKRWLVKYNVSGEWYKWNQEQHNKPFPQFLTEMLIAERTRGPEIDGKISWIEWEAFRDKWLLPFVSSTAQYQQNTSDESLEPQRRILL